MTDKLWEPEEINGKYMEVIITQEDGEECVYWVNLEKLNDDEDEYDWSIAKAVQHHNSLVLGVFSEDDVFAMEPFTRNESEFTFIE